jgi:transketolase
VRATDTLTTSGVDLGRPAVDTVCALAMNTIQKAGSGHPGTAMALARPPMCHGPGSCGSPGRPGMVRPGLVRALGRPRVVLQYAVLHLTGYPLSIGNLKQQRQWGPQTPGHPSTGTRPFGGRGAAGALPAGARISLALAGHARRAVVNSEV